MEGPHLTVPSVTMPDALASYMSNPLYVFDLNFLKIILKLLFMGFCRAKHTCYCL